MVEGAFLDVVFDPHDVAIKSHGDQAPGERVEVLQRLWVNNGTVVEVDHCGCSTKEMKENLGWPSRSRGLFISRSVRPCSVQPMSIP